MTCSRCGKDVAPEEAILRGDGHVCEDCLMNMLSPSKACDPWAVKMAKGSLASVADAESSLQGLEKRLYDLVCAEGKVRKADLPSRLGVTLEQVERANAVLRHMELLRGQKDPDGSIFVTRFSAGRD
jgi:DNA-directed RNA polymerase subunit RPC12/RpoP